MLNPGDHIGRYAIERLLGVGGMGVVYQAADDRLNRKVALKVLHPKLSEDKQSVAFFKREAELQAMLAHPNIVTMYDLVEDNGYAALVMEYVEGDSLDSVIRRMGLIPPGRCLPLFQQIAEGVAYAHYKGVVHRDLKPANILLKADNTAKVTDFGIARMVTQETRLTRMGSSLGTLGYMSPEVANCSDATEISDVYSLGAVLYEMLTGTLPYEVATLDELQDALQNRQITQPDSIYPYIPASLSELVVKSLAVEPAQRPQSVRAMLTLLADIRIDGDNSPISVGTGAFANGRARTSVDDVASQEVGSRSWAAPIRTTGAAHTASVPQMEQLPASRASGSRKLILIGASALAIVALVAALLFSNTNKFPAGPRYVITENYFSRANMRPGPTKDGAVIDKLPYRTVVQALPQNRESDEFLLVSYNGQQGYISRGYLSIQDPDSIFLIKQRGYSPISLRSSYTGIIGKNTDIQLYLSQSGNFLSGQVSISWRKSGKTKELVREVSAAVKGRLDYATRTLEIGLPRNQLDGWLKLTAGPDGTQLEGTYYPYEPGESHVVQLKPM